MISIDASLVIDLMDDPKKITNHYGKDTGMYKTIANLKIVNSLVLNNKNYEHMVVFENCEFESITILDSYSNSSIFFFDCKFKDEFKINSLESENLLFQNCQFEKSLTIFDCKLDKFTFYRVESKSGLIIKGGEIGDFRIDTLDEKTHFSLIGKFLLIKELRIVSVTGITLFSRGSIINKLTLTGYYNSASRMDFSNIFNNYIYLNDLNNDGKIYLSNLKSVEINSFKFKFISDYVESFRKSPEFKKNDESIITALTTSYHSIIISKYLNLETSNIKFKDFIIREHYIGLLNYEAIYRKPEFEINYSSAGILELKNILFELYELKFISSDLSSIKLINSKIPNLRKNDDFLNYYNIYNDLYSSASKQNNVKDKVDYYRTSQKYLYRYLKDEAGPPRDFGSIITIKISGLYSSHGCDWVRAICVTVFLTFIFFTLFVNNLDCIYFSPNKIGVKYFFYEIFPFFPQFLNPLHKIEFMDKISSLGFWSGWIDLMGRIFIGIGIFEIIRSFRKYVRQ